MLIYLHQDTALSMIRQGPKWDFGPILQILRAALCRRPLHLLDGRSDLVADFACGTLCQFGTM
jgi:hypothetical protein